MSLGFELEAIDSPIIVDGLYDMTFTAANECTQLPTVARQRTYRAQVYPNGGGGGRLSATIDNIEPLENGFFDAEVRGEPPRTLRVHVVTDPFANIGIVERIGPDIFLEVIGSAELPLGAQPPHSTGRSPCARPKWLCHISPNIASCSADDVPVSQSPAGMDAPLTPAIAACWNPGQCRL